MNNSIRFSLLAVLLFLSLQASPVFASEVTGNLSTGISGTVGNTLQANVVSPAPVSTGGGGSGGSSHSSFSSGGSAPKTTVSTTPTAVTTTSAASGQVLGVSTYNFATDLTIGSQSNDVQTLQSTLIAGGYLALSTPTGYFGPITKAAVAKYQAAHNISPTGYVGPLTRSSLNAGTVSVTAPQDIASTIAGLLEQVKTLQAQLAARTASTTAQ